MRIVTWNMNQRDRTDSQHQRAWDFLFNELGPDIALVQEAVVRDQMPVGYEAPLWTQAWEESKSELWGSAILSRVGKLTLIPLPTGASRVQIAQGNLQDIGFATVANIHARTDDLVIPALEGTFGAIGEAIQSRQGDPFIVGGDFNTGRSAADQWASTGHRKFWDWIDASQFKEPMPFDQGERQSFWREWDKNTAPSIGNSLQDDHVLLEAGLAERVTECLVWDTREVRGLSDHGPIVVDLALT